MDVINPEPVTVITKRFLEKALRIVSTEYKYRVPPSSEHENLKKNSWYYLSGCVIGLA